MTDLRPSSFARLSGFFRKERALELALLLVFIGCLGLHLWSATRDFTDPLLGLHAFRKTQTAISAYYQVKDGFSLDYETPALGAPWSIPMEFPLFQWTVAALVRVTGMDLDQAGRLVSLLCFYLCLPAVFLLTNRLGARKENARPSPLLGLAPCCLLLVSPMYIYWSATFMIESMALCCCLWQAWLLSRWRDAGERSALALALVLGTLAGLVKITTLLVFLAPEACLFGSDLLVLLRGGGWRNRDAQRRLLGYALIFGVPLAAALFWTGHADAVKAQNPMAGFLLSAELRQWNFGTLDQRLDPSFWAWIGRALRVYGVGSWLLLPLLAFAAARKDLLAACLLCLVGYLTGPLLFTNLYFVHDYYHYAIVIFPLLALGLGARALLERAKLRVAGLLVFCCMLFLPYASYRDTYYREQISPKTLPERLLFLREVVNPNEVLLIYGEDWDSATPYHAQRRALMNRSNWPLSHPKLQRSIELTGKERIVALLKSSPDPELNAFFGFSPTPATPGVYLRTDVQQRAFLRLFGVDLARSSAAMPLLAYPYLGRLRLLCAPPGRLVAPLQNGAQHIAFEFGLIEGAGAVRFRVLGQNGKDGAPKPLFERVVSPTSLGAQQARVAGLGLGPGSLLIFETDPLSGSGAEPTPAFWSDIRIR
jgi:hypothetical protein